MCEKAKTAANAIASFRIDRGHQIIDILAQFCNAGKPNIIFQPSKEKLKKKKKPRMSKAMEAQNEESRATKAKSK